MRQPLRRGHQQQERFPLQRCHDLQPFLGRPRTVYTLCNAVASLEKGAGIVCLSALLTVTMMAMKTTIEAFQAAGIRDQVRVLVGGAPVTRQFAEQIGADGYGENASHAVSLARSVTIEAA